MGETQTLTHVAIAGWLDDSVHKRDDPFGERANGKVPTPESRRDHLRQIVQDAVQHFRANAFHVQAQTFVERVRNLAFIADTSERSSHNSDFISKIESVDRTYIYHPYTLWPDTPDEIRWEMVNEKLQRFTGAGWAMVQRMREQHRQAEEEAVGMVPRDPRTKR